MLSIKFLHWLVFLGLNVLSNQPNDSLPSGVGIDPLEKGGLNAQSHDAATHQETVDVPLLALLANDGSPDQPVVAKSVDYMQIVDAIFFRLHKASDILNLIALGRQIELIRLIEQLHHTIKRITRREIDRDLNFERLQVIDRKSTRLNSSHVRISYAVFCLKKKKKDVISTHQRQQRADPLLIKDRDVVQTSAHKRREVAVSQQPCYE